MVWAIILCVRSVAFPDSILVSSNQGSDLTQDESQKNQDIYFRDPFFLSCNASFCFFLNAKQLRVGTEVQWPHVLCFPKSKTAGIKTTAPWRSGNGDEWKNPYECCAYSSLLSTKSAKPPSEGEGTLITILGFLSIPTQAKTGRFVQLTTWNVEQNFS